MASPERMATFSPQRAWTDGLPRRTAALSMMSSCSSVKLWKISTAAAAGSAWSVRSEKTPQASSSSIGRSRLPPPDSE